MFTPTSPSKIVQQQLYEAQRLHLEHEAAAEHHKALSDMFKARVARLSAPAAELVPKETA